MLLIGRASERITATSEHRVRNGDAAMAKFDEEQYRAHAAECQRMADASAREDDKRQWLSLAQSWLGLISSRERPAQAPDAESRAEGSGPNDSKAPL
jgi:hypothetical protein